MKSLINLFLLSLFVVNSSFANPTNISVEPQLINSEKTTNKGIDLNQKLKEIEELLKIIAVAQVESQENNKLSTIATKENNKTSNDTNIAKVLNLLKSSANKTANTFTYIVDKGDKILSKKTLIALCLVLGPLAYLSPKIVPAIIKYFAKKSAQGAVFVLDKTMDAGIEVAKENSSIFTKAIGINLALAGTAAATTEIPKAIIAKFSVSGIKTLGSALISYPFISIPFMVLPIGPTSIFKYI